MWAVPDGFAQVHPLYLEWWCVFQFPALGKLALRITSPLQDLLMKPPSPELSGYSCSYGIELVFIFDYGPTTEPGFPINPQLLQATLNPGVQYW